MMIKNNQLKYNQFRQSIKFITFETINCFGDDAGQYVELHFNLNDQFHFYPSFHIPVKNDWSDLSDKPFIDTMAFFIGMVELISYWKIACPERIIVKPFKLSARQIRFWEKLYFYGLAEFFYTNGIATSPENFAQFISESEIDLPELSKIYPDNHKVIVPVGGGKDSVVTLELLKQKYDVVPFVVNPIAASLHTIEIAGFDRSRVFEIHRNLDPLMLEMNKQGYLNGHTPFSALLAFYSVFAAGLTQSKHIALSNEASANEPTVKEGANHQYSKSFEFEKDFRDFSEKYLKGTFNYFSFLRPLNEFRIAGLFSRFPQYFNAFRSCNVGSKTGIWCGNCPKCLFAYIILSPHIDRDIMINIFGYDLFSNESLKQYLEELSGISEIKPFECVGTVDEVNFALRQIINNYSGELPVLLEFYRTKQGQSAPFNQFQNIASEFNVHHFLDDTFLDILKSALHD